MSWLVELATEVERTLGRDADAKRVPLPVELAERAGVLGDAPATMHSRAWSLPGIPWLRVACLDAGDRARVFSALALPDPSRVLPMFGAEVVEIRGQVTVIAVDWMPVGETSIDEAALAAIRKEFDDFPPGGDLPDWAATAFSPYALYSRPRTATLHHRIRHAVRRYLHGYLGASATAPKRTDSEAAADEIARYCREHFENDPGGRMLNAIFGSAWVERYATEFLFRIETTGRPGNAPASEDEEPSEGRPIGITDRLGSEPDP